MFVHWDNNKNILDRNKTTKFEDSNLPSRTISFGKKTFKTHWHWMLAWKSEKSFIGAMCFSIVWIKYENKMVNMLHLENHLLLILCWTPQNSFLIDFLREDTMIGTSFLRVAAHDDDFGTNAAVTYSMSSEQPEYLRVNPLTGWVYVNQPISQVCTHAKWTQHSVHLHSITEFNFLFYFFKWKPSNTCCLQ